MEIAMRRRVIESKVVSVSVEDVAVKEVSFAADGIVSDVVRDQIVHAFANVNSADLSLNLGFADVIAKYCGKELIADLIEARSFLFRLPNAVLSAIFSKDRPNRIADADKEIVEMVLPYLAEVEDGMEIGGIVFPEDAGIIAGELVDIGAVVNAVDVYGNDPAYEALDTCGVYEYFADHKDELIPLLVSEGFAQYMQNGGKVFPYVSYEKRHAVPFILELIPLLEGYVTCFMNERGCAAGTVAREPFYDGLYGVVSAIEETVESANTFVTESAHYLAEGILYKDPADAGYSAAEVETLFKEFFAGLPEALSVSGCYFARAGIADNEIVSAVFADFVDYAEYTAAQYSEELAVDPDAEYDAGEPFSVYDHTGFGFTFSEFCGTLMNAICPVSAAVCY